MSSIVAVVPPPKDLPGFPQAKRTKPKTPFAGGSKRARWKDDAGAIYEWDYQHGHVEKYDSKGNHAGGFDAVSGAQVSEADKTRRVDP